MVSHLSYLEGPPLSNTPLPTPWECFLASVSSTPDAPALIALHQAADLYSIPSLSPPSASDPYLRWTYRILHTAITQLATALQAHGIGPGMPVVTFLPNGAEYILTKMAAHMLGCLFAPLNPRSLVSTEEVSHLLRTFLLHAPVGEILIVAEEESIASISSLDYALLEGAVKVAVFSPTPTAPHSENSWIPFETLMNSSTALSPNPFPYPTDDMLLCTSGTTSRPKVCALTTAHLSATLHTLSQHPRHNFTRDIFICVAPNNHVAGTEAFLCALSFSGTIVFPSARFDIDSFIRATQLEKATYTILVPTMVLALCRGRTEKIGNFRSLNLGASPVTEEVLRLCKGVLACERICGVFGSTEGAFLRTGDRGVEELVGGVGDSHVAVGWDAAVGQVVKVCEPGDPNALVALGGVGELHMSSPEIVGGYIGQEGSAQFYTDGEGRRWYNTGDQARIDGDGRIYVLGRYKDVIIRGGENIAPAAVEAVLEPTMGHLGVQIVGAIDEDGLAGEVPVVVTLKRVDAETAAAIRDAVVERMGAACAPDEVISLEDLALEDYPRTAVGKVQKHKLAALVGAYRKKRRRNGIPTPPYSEDSGTETTAVKELVATTDILDHLVRIWSQTIGIYDERRLLSPDTDVATLPVDSIALMRVRDRLAKALDGNTLSLAELGKGGTIRQQATLLRSRKNDAQPKFGNIPTLNSRRGEKEARHPPEVEDMVHLTEDPSLLDRTKEIVTEAIQGCGLSWENVRAVMPTTDFNAVSLRVGNMWHLNLKLVVITRKNVAKERLRASLHRVIENNPMMASFIVADAEKLGKDLALHIEVELSEAFVNEHVLADAGMVKSPSEMVEFAKQQHFPGCRDAVPPGPLSKLWLFDVEETGSAGFVVNGTVAAPLILSDTNHIAVLACHSIFDNTFTQLVYEDLELTLTSPTVPLQPHVAYQLWADSYYTLRTSPAARAAVSYHSTALQGLHTHEHAIWPPHPPVYAPRNITIPETGENGVVRVFDVPGWLELKGAHPEVSSPIPLKAAFALFLLQKTGHTHAMFAQVESERRRWPFLPKSFGDYPASDVGGLTMQTVNNLVSAVPGETVISFLQRMQDTQTLQTKHASAPRALIIEALGPESAGTFPRIASNSTFNWLGATMPNSKDQFKQIEVVEVVISRAMFGFFLMGGMIVIEGGVKLWIKVQGLTFGENELDEMAGELQRLTQWLVREENWGRRVEELQELYV